MGTRRKARELAMQALFFMDMQKEFSEEGFGRFCANFSPKPEVRPFFLRLVNGVLACKDELDQLVERFSENWSLSRMSCVDRNVMRIAVFELACCRDIPAKVSINEAVDIGKKFGTDESGAFINGISARSSGPTSPAPSSTASWTASARPWRAGRRGSRARNGPPTKPRKPTGTKRIRNRTNHDAGARGRQRPRPFRRDTMLIQKLAVGPIQANCFIVGCEETRQAAVIDPGDEADRILLALAEAKLTVVQIINTHGHFDHVGANRRMKQATGAPLLIHALDAPMLGLLARSAAAWGMSAENSPPPDRTIDEGDLIQAGTITFRVIHTPGHTPGGVSLLAGSSLFVGDTLFAGSVGRTDFPGGSFDELKASIQRKLFALPPDVTVYTGHGPETTIGEEKLDNPFVGMGI